MSASLASTLNLILQIAVFIILIAAIRFAKLKTKEGFKAHRTFVVLAIVLNLVGVILVMIPSDITFLSAGLAALPLTPLVISMTHGVFGALALIFGIAFVFNKKPKKVRLWMRLTALFWFVAIFLGIIEYLVIAGIL